MQGDFTKSDRKRIRQLADLAWERGLRFELRKIAVAIEEMERPFDTVRRHGSHSQIPRRRFSRPLQPILWFAPLAGGVSRLL